MKLNRIKTHSHTQFSLENLLETLVLPYSLNIYIYMEEWERERAQIDSDDDEVALRCNRVKSGAGGGWKDEKKGL